MTTWAIWSALRKVPRAVWGFLGLLLVCGSLVWWSEARRSAAYQQGKRDAASGVVFDSVMLERAAVRVAKAMAHTDTVIRVVIQRRDSVRVAIETLPDSAKRLPEVARLVVQTERLLVSVDSLTTAHATERMAWTEKAKVDSAAIYSLRVIATAKGDSVTALKKRPTWKRLVGTTLVIGVAAFAGGKA